MPKEFAASAIFSAPVLFTILASCGVSSAPSTLVQAAQLTNRSGAYSSIFEIQEMSVISSSEWPQALYGRFS